MKTELKPCPFCGGEAHATTGFTTGSDWPQGHFDRIFCGKCQVRQLFHRTKTEAIEAWNDRATPPSPSTAEVDDLLGRYWEIAYSEGKTGESRGSEAQEILSSLRAALASRPAVEAGELPPLPDAQPAPVALPNLVSVDEIEEAIKETEYPYFGKLDLNHKQHGAVDVLVRCAKSLLASLAPAAESVRQVPAGDFLPAREVVDEIVLLSEVMREHPQLKWAIGREALLMRCVRKALAQPGAVPQVPIVAEVDAAMVKVLRDKADTARAALATKPATKE